MNESKQDTTTGSSRSSQCGGVFEELERLIRVKNNKSDVRALCVRLALYVAGNHQIFSMVTVPAAEQERCRMQSRLREQLRRNASRIEAQGRSLLLNQGHHVKGLWVWEP